MTYPKWLYHSTRGARIVTTLAEQTALGAGWYESPALAAADTAASNAVAAVVTADLVRTFNEYVIIVVDGVPIRCRPRLIQNGVDLVIGWQQQLNGVWKDVATQTNP